MFGRLMPREGNFFELFNAHADRIVEGARELASMISSFSSSDSGARCAIVCLRSIPSSSSIAM